MPGGQEDTVVTLPDDAGNLVLGVVIFFLIGALWMRLFWRVLDPWSRKALGRVLGVHIHLGETSIWQINQEPVDSTNWRNIIVRPAQMILLMTGGLVPFVVTVAIMSMLMR